MYSQQDIKNAGAIKKKTRSTDHESAVSNMHTTVTIGSVATVPP